MATTTAGVNQDTLNQLQIQGQRPFDSQLFSSVSTGDVQNLSIPTLTNPVQAFTLNQQNAPNTSVQNRQLANIYNQANAQAFNTQDQAIRNSANQQTQALVQQRNTAVGNDLALFGQSGFIDSGQSSRNLSYLTNRNAQFQQQLGNVTNQALQLLNQNTASFAQNQLQAFSTFRNADFQDRQQNFNENFANRQQDFYERTTTRQQAFNEAIARGQETGFMYDYDPRTGDVRATDNMNLQGMQFEDNLRNSRLSRVSERIRQAQAVSSDTGKVPTYQGLLDDNRAFNPTRQGATFTQQGDSNNLALEASRAQLPTIQAQSQYQTSMFKELTTQGVAQKEVADKVADLEQKNLQRQADEVQLKAEQARNQEIIKNLSGAYGLDTAQLISNANLLKDAINRETDPAKQEQLLTQLYDTKDKIDAINGTGLGIYYSPQILRNNDSGKEEVTYVPDNNGLAKFGYDGNAVFETARSEQSAKDSMENVRKSFTNQFINGLVKNENINDTINKVFFTNKSLDADSDGSADDKLLVAVANANPETGQKVGYNYYQIDLSGLSVNDKLKFNAAIKDGKQLGEDLSVPQETKYAANNPGSLNALNKFLLEYDNNRDPSKRVVISLDSTSFYTSMQNFGVANQGVFEVGEGGKIPNKDVLRALILGQNSDGKSLINSTTLGMQKVDNVFNSVHNILDEIDNQLRQGGTIQKRNDKYRVPDGLQDSSQLNREQIYQAILKGQTNLELDYGAGKFELDWSSIQLPEKDNLNNLRQWYKNFSNSQKNSDGTIKGSKLVDDAVNTLIAGRGSMAPGEKFKFRNEFLDLFAR